MVWPMRRLPPWERSDALGDALHALRLRGTYCSHSELQAPFGLTMPAFEGCLWFHAMLEGELELVVRGQKPVRLVAGDVALLPKGLGHRLQAGAPSAWPDVTTLEQRETSDHHSVLRYGGRGAKTVALCGVVKLDHACVDELVAALPEVVLQRRVSLHDGSGLGRVLGLLADEARTPQAGGAAIVTRLADVVVLQALRDWLASSAQATGFLAALRDVELGRAMAAMHRAPEKPWTVASLAKTAAMSRSKFAARFQSVVGEAPMRYLTRQRMRAAAKMLGAGDETVANVAGHFGYASEAAFHRAFRRVVGAAPGAYKRPRAR